MTVKEVMSELKSMASEQTKKTWLRHGAKEPIFGVKVQDLKKIVKLVKKDHELSLQLYDTGNGDAMYLAGLIADEKQINKAQLNKWVKTAEWSMISEYTVAWVAAESNHGWDLALKWIDSKKEHIAAAGWATLSNLVALKEDNELDLKAIEKLMQRAGEHVHDDRNRVSYTMNGFIISVGCYISSLSLKAQKMGEKIGKVEVNMGNTACKVPQIDVYIQKVISKNRLGKKKISARC